MEREKCHELKCDLTTFYQLRDGRKTSELRKNDSQFQEGDFLIIRAWGEDAKYFNLSRLFFRITHVLEGFEGLKSGYVILSLKQLE